MDSQLLAKIEINSARLPEVYNNAVTALKNCVEIDEVKDWTDKMAAIASYWRQTNDETMFNMAQKIRAQSYRRMGELLSEYDGRGNYSEQSKKDIGVRFTKTEIATQSGLSERETKTATRLSNIPEPEFNDLLEAEKVPTITELAKHGTKSILTKPKPEGYAAGIHLHADFKNLAESCKRLDADYILNALDDDYKNEMFEFFDEIINWIDTYKLNY
jgi:hypothetical protein